MSDRAGDTSWGIHWFRRDLRLAGNEALHENWRRNAGQTVGLFCFDSQFLSRDDFSHNRFAFFLETLKALQSAWRNQGGDLLVVDCPPLEAFAQILKHCRARAIRLPSLVTWGVDYEPYARDRDLKVETFLAQENVATHHARDHLLFEPHEILKTEKAGDHYQVFTPYSKKWIQTLHSDLGENRIQAQKHRANERYNLSWQRIAKDLPLKPALDNFVKENQKHVTVEIPKAGFDEAQSRLKLFRPKLASYNEDRDVPSIVGTSRLSMFLKNGSLTTAQIIHFLKLNDPKAIASPGPLQYLKELIWREFYYSILYHRPEVEKTSFRPQYAKLAWQNNVKFFEKWQQGRTGFPIVDAGMRELLTTGWMHNRVRMITASFLTKDLLIDWRWGEQHFMKHLLDGDLAPNNGGWQWAASTGCDPQPYFRVFNPWLQGLKFDPAGEYIKNYLPELRKAPTKALHEPTADRSPWNYPAPIVEHSEQRDLAIQLYKRYR